MRTTFRKRLASRLCGFAIFIIGLPGCFSVPVVGENTIQVGEPAGGYEQVWNTSVRILDKYFDIANENRYLGTIETHPETGATLIEVWRPDAVGLFERLEGSLQTIRRRGFVKIQPMPERGYLVSIEVYKELEHLPQPIYSNFGGGTLLQSIQPLQDPVIDSDVPPSAGWISLGRDQKLETRIARDLSMELGGSPVNVVTDPPADLRKAVAPGPTGG